MLSTLGFVRVASISPSLAVGDVDFNTQSTLTYLEQAQQAGAAIALFPELGLTGYTCGDLFFQPLLQQGALQALQALCEANSPVAAIVGLPIMAGGRLYNCAAVVQSGRILGIVPKLNLPNYQQFYERRWFSGGASAPREITLMGQAVPMGADLIFRSTDGALAFGIEICEDLWTPNPPSGRLCQNGSQLIFNPSASDEAVAKHEYRRNLIAQQSGRCMAGYLYAGAGPDESTTDMVFGGYTCVAENGRMLAEGKRFVSGAITVADIDVGRLDFLRSRCGTFYQDEPSFAVREIGFAWHQAAQLPLQRFIAPRPFVPEGSALDERSEEITAIQVASLKKRMLHTGIRKAAVNVSGGLDSALTFLVAARLFSEMGWDLKDLHAITLPGFGTGARTKNNALGLIEQLGATLHQADITPAVLQHFKDIGHDPAVLDITYENAQARERTQILMDYANRIGALALGTGDLSEMALGWSTYNGDHMSMYNVNCGVPKTLVRHLVRWLSRSFTPEVAVIADDILDTPVSPELLPSRKGEIDQRTEDILGPYELHDFFLYNMIEGGASPKKLLVLAKQALGDVYDDTLIKTTLRTFIRRFFTQQFKRSCVPDGPRVGSVALSPRGDWRMPSDASAKLWMDEVEGL